MLNLFKALEVLHITCAAAQKVNWGLLLHPFKVYKAV
jgi:hypothetical protein